MTIAALLLVQSLLGETGQSPNDPPKRPAYKKHDHLRILVGEKPAARVDSKGHKLAVDSVDVTFTITAEVVDVRPNGVLVVQAIRRRKVNDDEELIRLTGDVSPDAIEAGSVKSDRVANLSVTVEGRRSF